MEWVWNIEKPGEKGRKGEKKNKRERKEGENYKTENMLCFKNAIDKHGLRMRIFI